MNNLNFFPEIFNFVIEKIEDDISRCHIDGVNVSVVVLFLVNIATVISKYVGLFVLSTIWVESYTYLAALTAFL